MRLSRWESDGIGFIFWVGRGVRERGKRVLMGFKV